MFLLANKLKWSPAVSPPRKIPNYLSMMIFVYSFLVRLALVRLLHKSAIQQCRSKEEDANVSQRKKPSGFLIKDSKGNLWGDDQAEFNNSWLLRLSHENDYLSWARNGYISSVAAVGILKIYLDNPELHSWALHASYAALGVSMLNTIGGGIYFLVTLKQLQDAMLMPQSYFNWNVFHTVANMCLMSAAVVLIIVNTSSSKSNFENVPENQ